jgi:hypothetical protein
MSAKILRCLACAERGLDPRFTENLKGLSDNGIKRPMCPRCLEEIDIEKSTKGSKEQK